MISLYSPLEAKLLHFSMFLLLFLDNFSFLVSNKCCLINFKLTMGVNIDGTRITSLDIIRVSLLWRLNRIHLHKMVKHTQTIRRQHSGIVWVCLTILRGWRLRINFKQAFCPYVFQKRGPLDVHCNCWNYWKKTAVGRTGKSSRWKIINLHLKLDLESYTFKVYLYQQTHLNAVIHPQTLRK